MTISKMPSKKKLEAEYDQQGHVNKLAEKYGVKPTTIHNWFRKLGIRTNEQKLRDRFNRRYGR